jgi:hypothetical protein
VTDDPGTKLTLKAFHATLTREDIPVNNVELPVVGEVDQLMIEENFRRIQVEIGYLVKDVLKQLAKDQGHDPNAAERDAS